MLDSLSVEDGGESSVGLKLVSANEQVFSGHFPGHPILPGVLQVAAMAQSAKALFLAGGAAGRIAVFGARKVKFRKPVLPGMALRVETVRLQSNEDGTVDYQSKCTVDGELASSGIVTLGVRPPEWFAELPGGESPLAAKMTGAQAGVAELMQSLPHRFPFLLVDGAYHLGEGTEALGFKNVTSDDCLVQGTANGQYPGYLQIETAAQLGCAHILSRPEYHGKLGFFMSVDRAVFHHPVYAGDRLDVEITSDFGGRYGSAAGRLHVGGALVTEVELKFVIAEP